MNDILGIEILLNMFNTVFAKAVYLNNEEAIQELSAIRHSIYYTDFDYEKISNLLQEINSNLDRHE